MTLKTLLDDCAAHDGRLLTLAEVAAVVGRPLEPATAVETACLADALGRVLAEDVISPLNVPPHDNAAVDGYAVRRADLAESGPTTLPVALRIPAGTIAEGALPAGTAARIFTGAPTPEGADCVLMQEDCTASEDGTTVTIPAPPKPGANRRRAGEDVAAGTVVLTAGRRLRPQDLGMAATVGRAVLPVRAPLRVAVFSTGDELLNPGTAHRPGAIYDANRFSLRGLVGALGCTVTDLGILPDRRDAVAEALAAAAPGHDLVMTSGGVSVGEEDHVKAAVAALGELHLWRMAIKPGKPAAVGRIGATPFVGLPGNPVAAMVTFALIAAPLARGLAGRSDRHPRRLRLPAGFAETRRKGGRREFLRGMLETDAAGFTVVRPYPAQGSAILSSMVAADCLIEVPEDLAEIVPGQPLAVILLGEAFS